MLPQLKRRLPLPTHAAVKMLSHTIAPLSGKGMSRRPPPDHLLTCCTLLLCRWAVRGQICMSHVQCADTVGCPQDPSGEAASQAQKHLTYYELDLGLNHVLRKWSEPIDNGANLLIPVPGGGDGPGGVLVAADNFIIYRDEGHEEASGTWAPKADCRPLATSALPSAHASQRLPSGARQA